MWERGVKGDTRIVGLSPWKHGLAIDKLAKGESSTFGGEGRERVQMRFLRVNMRHLLDMPVENVRLHLGM